MTVMNSTNGQVASMPPTNERPSLPGSWVEVPPSFQRTALAAQSIQGGKSASLQNPQAHPKHYNVGKYEVIDVIEDWKLGFNLGNVVKYVARADHKGASSSDLYKALFYLNRELANRERNVS